MTLRFAVVVAFLVSLATFASCGGGGGATGGRDAGRVEDAGEDAGLELTLEELRANLPPGQGLQVRVKNLTVHTVEFGFTGSQGDTQYQFWATDESGQRGIFIDKEFQDQPGAFVPDAGDVIDVEGFYWRLSSFDHIVGRRPAMTHKDAVRLKITQTAEGRALPPYLVVDAGEFGNADAGRNNSNNHQTGGARVWIKGPITLTNARPPPLQSESAKPEDQNPATAFYNGFEVTGGILVVNRKARTNCDYRAAAAGGSTVTFRDGIRGVWDTYTFARCADGGTFNFTCFPNLAGRVPNTSSDGGTGSFQTYVLHPQSCDDLDGGL